ncbi:MAG TPA: sigma factor [Candidatus Limnocylindrales bacterium]|nr:sigma factor [Candidatus Limnocylindrales bacterium]
MDSERAAAEFEQHRAHLTGVAYRMLGTLADAEDAVQETYLRFARTNADGLRDVPAWLTTTVARICLDELGSARSRRESYVGPWLPEPIVDTGSLAAIALDPEDRVTLDESVSMAIAIAEAHTFSSDIRSVNGSAGLVFQNGGEVVGVMGFTVAGNHITEIDFVLNPEKLRRVARR